MKRKIVLVVFSVLTTAPAWAVANNCGVHVNATSDAPGGTTNPTGFSTFTTLNTEDGSDLGTDAGCQIINKVFDNFAVGTTGEDGEPNSTDEISMWGTFNSNVETLLFDVVDAADWNVGGAGTVVKTTTIDFLAKPVGGSSTFGLAGVGFQHALLNTANESIGLRVLVCFDQSTTCNGGYDFNQLFSVSGSFSNAVTNNIFGGAGFSNVLVNNFTVRLVLTMTEDSGGVFVNNFFIQFADTPEPATFGLMGSALVGMGILAYRRRRKKA